VYHGADERAKGGRCSEDDDTAIEPVIDR
jgi:hypothetical protein